MSDEKKLIINRGEEFKLYVKDKIDKMDIFYDQYIAAARMLDDILAKHDDNSDIWCNIEYENNIIAFCGERGEGKSSAMISFAKAVYEHRRYDKSSIFKDCKNVENANFTEPIIIDPSMLDGVHNVLDIILATLYKKFKDQYDKDNQFFYTREREELLDQFQQVYKRVSLINNQEKMLDDEYDYEGNISKLSKLGQSTELRNEFEKLIKMYIESLLKIQRTDRDQKKGSLLIAIDDLDLCSSHAYKIAEQIRKYLIIPDVIVVMAIRIEQLELCVREQNLINYENMVKMEKQESGILEEINNMSERYVAKLIPKTRRNYLLNVRAMNHVEIVYRDRDRDMEIILSDNLRDSSVSDTISNLIYEKTGMKFLEEKTGTSYFLPDNLRDMINIILFLADMKEPDNDGKIFYDNIQKFSNYFEKQWLFSNFSLKESKEIQKLVHKQDQLHEDIAYLLYERYELTKKKGDALKAQFIPELPDSFFVVMNWLEVYQKNVFGEDEKKFASVFRILYTIRLNELLKLEQNDKMINFIGGYIWAGGFQNVLPNVYGTMIDRSRFMLSTYRAFNVIAEELYSEKNILLPEPVGSQYYVTEIDKNDENRKYKIITWVLLGIFSNTFFRNSSYQMVYTFNTLHHIYANHSVLPSLHISLENYIVSLCTLESVYKKVDMEYLGITVEEFRTVIEEIQKSNKEIIECFKKIISNIDIVMQFKEYCSKNNEIKESGEKDDITRTQNVINRFFRNTEYFIKEYFDINLTKSNCLKIGSDNDKIEIKISHLYALFVQAGIEESTHPTAAGQADKNRVNMVKDFAEKLRNRSGSVNSLEKVSAYLVTRTAQNAKKNMDNLASNIQRYYSIHIEEDLKESEILDLCSFYGKIIDQYLLNPSDGISDDLSNEYKLYVKRYQKTCR